MHEALLDTSLDIYKLHLSTSNAPSKEIDTMLLLAKKRGIEVAYHDKKRLSFISKNGKQDQGVALDIEIETFISEEKFLKEHTTYRLFALDGLTNPQNIGMIVRSAAAGNIDGIILPLKKGTNISPLIIKASVGTLFKIPILKTTNLAKTVENFSKQGATLYNLSTQASTPYNQCELDKQSIFVLGNESSGVSKEIEKLCNKAIFIPMRREVESLNVAVTASLLSFLD